MTFITTIETVTGTLPVTLYLSFKNKWLLTKQKDPQSLDEP